MPKSKKRKQQSLMRFLTRRWYWGEYSKAKERSNFAAHMRRRQEIAPLLPADVHTLMNTDLNDAECRKFERDLKNKTLCLTLRSGGLPSGYFDVVLQYEGAALFSRDNGIAVLLSESKEELLAGMTPKGIDSYDKRVLKSGSFERAEVLYHEVDIAKNGAFEHRLLLWPYGELLIRFRHLFLTQTLVASRDAP